MSETNWQRVLGRALEKDLIQLQDLFPAGHEWETEAARQICLRLMDTGKLREEQVAHLNGDPAGHSVNRTAEEKALPEEAQKTITLEPVVVVSRSQTPKIAHYRIKGLLGKGGMGEVYEAYDGHLDRLVALKVLKGSDEKALQRFLREAKAQARVDHEHICKVYDAGVRNGQPFIAMQYIRGDTLKHVGPGLSLTQKVKVIRDVAFGVHAAHRQGVIHRDLKPGNIMLTNLDSGEWKPFVMDFGLARAPTIDSLTAKGALLGTVHYMSPEQARGSVDDLDRRTDVYSLGGTLFFLLAGRSPLEGKSVAEILHTLGREGVPSLASANPALPRDLIAIVDKCLQRNRQERYPTARALAEDLSRFLDGEPVEALPSSIPYRLGKKVSKHRVVAGAITFTLLVLLGSLLWISYARLRSAERTRLVQSYAQRVERIEALARYTHMLPAHDVLKEYGAIRAQLEKVTRELPMLEGIAVGPGNYALGRGYLVLGEYEEAVTHLTSAWQANYRAPEVAYALGVALARRYQYEALTLMAIRDPGAREKRRREIEDDYREPALEYLQMARGLGTESADYIQSLISFQKKEYDQALHKAALAFEEIPWLYEALALQGEIYVAMAREALFRGENDRVTAYFDAATDMYDKALAIAGSDPGLYLSLSSLWQMRMIAGIHRDDPEIAAYRDAAINACQRALAVLPDLAAAHQAIAKVHLRWCEYLQYHGKDMQSALQDASKAAQFALELEPEHAETLNVLGLVSVWRGIYRASIGDDPRHDYDEAIKALTKAEQVRPGDTSTIVRLGLSLGRLGWYEKDHGFDALASLEAAGQKFSTALEMEPGSVLVLVNLATNHAMLAETKRMEGKDPLPDLQQAVALSREILKINPQYVLARANMGKFLDMQARYLIDLGKDPSKPLLEALDVLGDCVRELPNYFEIREWLGVAWLTLAHWEFIQGEDPGTDISRAELHLHKVMETNRVTTEARVQLAFALQLRRMFAVRNNRPLPPTREIADLLQHAIDDKPAGEYFLALGSLHLFSAELALREHRTAAAELTSARAALIRGEALKPWDLDIHTGFALYHLLAACASATSNPAASRSGAEEIEAGLARTGGILKINPNNAKARFIQALLCHCQARLEQGAKQNEWAERAKTDMAAALNLDPNMKLHHPFLAGLATL